jgi:hypothetical protein
VNRIVHGKTLSKQSDIKNLTGKRGQMVVVEFEDHVDPKIATSVEVK